jgi:hypothetical protein
MPARGAVVWRERANQDLPGPGANAGWSSKLPSKHSLIWTLSTVRRWFDVREALLTIGGARLVRDPLSN